MPIARIDPLHSAVLTREATYNISLLDDYCLPHLTLNPTPTPLPSWHVIC
jgi:hypothetical protein